MLYYIHRQIAYIFIFYAIMTRPYVALSTSERWTNSSGLGNSWQPNPQQQKIPTQPLKLSFCWILLFFAYKHMIDMYHMILYIFLLVILFLGNFFTNQSCETWWSNIWPKIPNSWHKMESKLGNTRQIGFEARRTGRGQPCNIILFSYHHISYSRIFTSSYFHIII